MKRTFLLFTLCFVLLCGVVWADKSESVVVAKLNRFADTLIEKIGTETGAPTIAVANFVNESRAAEDRQIGSAVADILNQRLTNSGRFLVVESRQIDRVIESLNMGLTGLYDEKKAASIGHLIGAEYLVLGSVTRLAGFYRVNVRMVEVETGATIVNESLELDAALIEKESLKYLPPRYRVRIGASGVYDTLSRDGLGCLGMTAGFSYEFRPRHSILARTTYYWSGGVISPLQDPTDLYGTRTKYLSELELMLGYGYTFRITRHLDAEMSMLCGLVKIPWEAETEVHVPVTNYTEDSGVYTDFFLYPELTFLAGPDNPISVFLSVGYRYAFYADEISFPSARSGTDFILPGFPFNDFRVRTGLQLYF